MRLWFSFLLTAIIGIANAQQVYTVEQCIQLASKNNWQIKNAELGKEKSDFSVKEVYGNLMPTVELRASYQYYLDVPAQLVPASSFGGPAGEYQKLVLSPAQNAGSSIQLTQLLFNQKALVGLKTARTVNALSSMQLAKSKEDIVFNVQVLYLNIQALEQNLVLIDSTLLFHEKNIKTYETMQVNQLVSKSSYNRLRLNFENLKSERENLVIAKEKSHRLLKYIIGIPLEDPIAVEPFDNTVPMMLNEELNLDSRLDLNVAKENVSLNEWKVKSAKSDFYPTLSAVYYYGLTGYNNKFSLTETINNTWIKNSYVGLQLSVPLFSGFSKVNRLRQSQIDLSMARNELAMARENGMKEITDSYHNYRSLLNSYHTAKRNFELAGNLLTNSTIEYRNGLVSISDLILLQTDHSNARNNYVNALIQLRIAALEYRKANGSLNNSK